jgi:hypothetical protein
MISGPQMDGQRLSSVPFSLSSLVFGRDQPARIHSVSY